MIEIKRNSILFPLTDRYNNSIAQSNGNIDGVPQNTQLVAQGYKLPDGFNKSRSPGELESLYNENSNVIYGKYNYDNAYTNTLFKFGPRQPFITINPNDGKKGVNGLKRYESRSFPIGSALQDVVRIGKFSVSSNGVIFLGKQLLLQSFNSFNETKLYNPLMPTLAASSIASFGIIPSPKRHIELGGGIGSIVGGVLGFGSGREYKAPKGTSGYNNENIVLPLQSRNVGGKGLIRGATASSAYKTLQSKIGLSSAGNSFKLSSAIGNYFKSQLSKLGQGLLPQKQPNGTYRADDTTYDQLQNAKNIFDYIDDKKRNISFNGINSYYKKYDNDSQNYFTVKADQKYVKNELDSSTDSFKYPSLQIGLVANSIKNYKKSTYTNRPDEGSYGFMIMAGKNLYNYYAENSKKIQWGVDFIQRWEAGKTSDYDFDSIKKNQETSVEDSKKTLKVFGQNIRQNQKYFKSEVGYFIEQNTKQYKKYGENVGIYRVRKNQTTPTYKYSDILNVYATYTFIKGTIEGNNQVLTDIKFVDKTNDAVAQIQKNLEQVINNIKLAGYEFTPMSDDDLLVQQFSNNSFIGMDNISYKTKDPDAQSQNVSVYNYNGGYSSQFRNKRKNLLDDRTGKGFAGAGNVDSINSLFVGDELTPDIIKFYFKDVVNNIYLPFRATVSGINEIYNADVDSISYAGRADKLYYYKGFTRSMSFKFIAIASSIKELLPMWQRINYLVGLTKPANYTRNPINNVYSKFIIPPLIEFTIGDIYLNQPGIIKSISLAIPDNATWEVLDESQSKIKDWAYLNNKITWRNSKGKYAQFPKECELNLSIDLLEKERPITGGSNFGDFARTLDSSGEYDNSKKNSQQFSSNLVYE